MVGGSNERVDGCNDPPANQHIPLSGKVEKDKHLQKVPARDGGYARFFVLEARQ